MYQISVEIIGVDLSLLNLNHSMLKKLLSDLNSNVMWNQFPLSFLYNALTK